MLFALEFDKRDRLTVEQMALTEFKPWMRHSFGERSRVVVFHPQILSEFETVELLGWKMLEELDRKSSR
jgi:hypothetical protein